MLATKGFLESETVNPTFLGWTSGSGNLKHGPIPDTQKSTLILKTVCGGVCIAKHPRKLAAYLQGNSRPKSRGAATSSNTWRAQAGEGSLPCRTFHRSGKPRLPGQSWELMSVLHDLFAMSLPAFKKLPQRHCRGHLSRTFIKILNNLH